MAAKEFVECLRSILQMDYGLVLISHATDKTFKNENGQEYNQIVPTLGAKPRNIVSRLCDIIGYARAVQEEDGTLSTKLFMRETPRYLAGSRFKYTPDYIDFTYQDLVNAIGDAIDKQAAEEGQEFFVDKTTNLYKVDDVELDFDKLMATFTSMINNLAEKVGPDSEQFMNYWNPRITQVIEKYLGKGQKVSQCSRDQVEALSLIVDELKDLIKNNT